jgi:hypothetical protein
MEALLVLITGTLNVVCFLIGAKVGQTVVKGEEIQMPEVKSPIQMYHEHQDRKEAEKEKNKVDIILQNIERYDGTANGQEDVPR